MISAIPAESWCCNNNDNLDELTDCVIPNGQCIINMDTGKIKMYDAEEKKWKPQ